MTPTVSAPPPPRLGPFQLTGRFALSPMAEFTSWPLRLLCQEFGSAFACTEMVKARFVAERHPETLKTIERHSDEKLVGAQICGSDEAELASSARFLTQEIGFPFVDFNIACPIRRVVADGAGGGLLDNPAKVERLVRVLAEAAAPAFVTVKMRSGLDELRITAVEVAQAAEAGGAKMIVLHPRTVKQAYGGKANHAHVADVKRAVKTPVAGGGDMNSPADAVRLLRESGCDFVYFGRGSVGNPWIFRRAHSLYEEGVEAPAPDEAEIVRVFQRHVEMLVQHLGEREASLHARKLSRYYGALFPDQARGTAFYDRLKMASTIDDVRASGK